MSATITNPILTPSLVSLQESLGLFCIDSGNLPGRLEMEILIWRREH
jgi:hypothetical protein